MAVEQKNERYYKILRVDLCHNGFTYKEGLNDDSDNYQHNVVCNHGLFFAKAKALFNYLRFGDLVCEVTIPEGARVSHFADKSKADKIVVSNIQPLKSSALWSDFDFCQGVIRQGLASRYKRLIKNAEALVQMVKNDGLNLAFIDEKYRTEEIVMAAVSNNGLALEYVCKKTKPVIEKALENKPEALEFVGAEDQTEDMVMNSIRRNGMMLTFVKIPRTPAMFRAAVAQDANALQTVDVADPLRKRQLYLVECVLLCLLMLICSALLVLWMWR